MGGSVTGHDGEVSAAQSSLMVHPGPSRYLVRAGADLTASRAPPSRSTAGYSRVSAPDPFWRIFQSDRPVPEFGAAGDEGRVARLNTWSKAVR